MDSHSGSGRSWLRGRPLLWVLGLPALLLACYTTARCAIVPFGHDESFTYLAAVSKGPREVLMLSLRDANNHPLNTWGMYVCSRLFGPSELSLRLPNLLAHLLYLVTSALLVRRLPGALAALAGFMVLNGSLMLLEFFSQARGYGIGLGFLMAAAWLGFETTGARSRRGALLFAAAGLVAATLAVVANYTFLHFYLAYCLCTAAALAVGRSAAEGSSRRRDLETAALFVAGAAWNSALLFLFAGREVIDLLGRGALYAGGSDGFWSDTIAPLIRKSLRGLLPTVPTARLVVGALLVCACLALVRTWRGKSRHGILPRYGVLAAMSLVAALGAALQAQLFGVLFLRGRTALQFLPLIGFLLVFLVAHLELSSRRGFRLVGVGLCAATTLFLGANLVRGANVTYPPSQFDADVRSMLADLRREHEQAAGTGHVRLGVSMALQPSVAYYRAARELSWLQPVTRRGLSEEQDFYYYLPKDAPAVEARGVEVLRDYPLTGNRLARRLAPR